MTRSHPSFVAALEEAQIAFPTMRSGQILVNAIGEDDLFYIEDDEAAQYILRYVQEGRETGVVRS